MKREQQITCDDLKGHVYFMLNGRGPFSKRRFVLEVVKEYLKEHPTASINEIKTVFNDDLQGRGYSGHFIEVDIESAKKKKDSNGSTRHMIEDAAILKSGDDIKFVVSSQWDYQNTLNIVFLACKNNLDVELLGHRLSRRNNRKYEKRKL